MFFYSLTFGGFSGFASALPGFFHDQFGFDPKLAGYCTAACVFAGSVMRPLGGVVADRIGGTRSLLAVYAAVTVLIAAAGFNLGGATGVIALFIGAMLCLGAGNGAVFQLVPQRFSAEIGVMTGLIGMAGGMWVKPSPGLIANAEWWWPLTALKHPTTAFCWPPGLPRLSCRCQAKT